MHTTVCITSWFRSISHTLNAVGPWYLTSSYIWVVQHIALWIIPQPIIDIQLWEGHSWLTDTSSSSFHRPPWNDLGCRNGVKSQQSINRSIYDTIVTVTCFHLDDGLLPKMNPCTRFDGPIVYSCWYMNLDINWNVSNSIGKCRSQ